MVKSLFALLIAFPLVAIAQETKKLVIIGDSITEGYGVAQSKAYPALLQQRIDKEKKPWRVFNSGISGSTSASAVSRIQWHLKQKPDLILLALGANDGLRGTPPKAMEENLDRAIAEAKKAGVKIVLAGMKMPPNYGAKYTKEYDAVFPRVAAKHGVPLIPFLLEKVGGVRDLNLPDGIHPNEKGHVIVADVVYNGLKGHL